jgi:hypothetical protein
VEKTKLRTKRAMLLKIQNGEKSPRTIRLLKIGKHSIIPKVRTKGRRSPAEVGGIVFSACALCLPLSLIAQVKPSAQGVQRPTARIPFVGCKSDGQLGPVDAPNGETRLPIDKGAASRLAYYKAEEGPGVLAPRGWYCFGTYGSNGATLYVSPGPIDTANLFSPNRKGFKGPAVQLSDEMGDTSGRFGVARIIALVFPAHREFVRKVIEEGLEPPSKFPFGPYPKDKLNYKSSEIVEYQTPAGADGLGTSSWLVKSADPISGVAILVGETPDLLHLSVRLPRDVSDLTPTIIHQVEREVARPDDRGR